MELFFVTEMQLTWTYLDGYGLVHAQEQGVKVEVVDWRLVHPLRVPMLDFQTNPDPFPISQARQQWGDEI